MLQYFRRIRRNLLNQGSVRKYLLYAVGEIGLVVIGILLALAIDNAREARQQQHKEETYLEGLRNDFQINRQKLITLREVNQQNLEHTRTILTILSDPEDRVAEDSLSQLFYSALAYDIRYNPNNSLLLEMMSSGSLKDLSNPELRIQLTNWLATLEDIAKQEEGLAQDRDKVLDLFRTGSYRIRTLFEHISDYQEQMKLPAYHESVSNMGLFRSAELENNLILFMLSTSATESAHYAPLQEQVEHILELLDAS
jgi:hypothetical protein